MSATLIDTDEAGTFLGTLNFHGTVLIDETGEAYTYAGVVESADPSGSVVATFPVTTSATRIRVDHDRAAATSRSPSILASSDHAEDALWQVYAAHNGA